MTPVTMTPPESAAGGRAYSTPLATETGVVESRVPRCLAVIRNSGSRAWISQLPINAGRTRSSPRFFFFFKYPLIFFFSGRSRTSTVQH